MTPIYLPLILAMYAGGPSSPSFKTTTLTPRGSTSPIPPTTSSGGSGSNKRSILYLVFPDKNVAHKWHDVMHIHQQWIRTHIDEHTEALEYYHLATGPSPSIGSRFGRLVRQSS